MARQNINVNPAVREFEAYMDFSGGINSEISNERVADNEFLQMVNVELSSRGSVKKRTGYEFVANVPSAEVTPMNVQGMFFYYRKNQPHPDIIFAREGRLYVKQFSNTSQTATQIEITGLSVFQKERIVEGVQFFDKLYVATGTDIVVVEFIYDEVNPLLGYWTAKKITPYEPIAQELKFIGTNSLLGFAMNNTNLTSGTLASDFDAKGIVFKRLQTDEVMRNGLKGDDITVSGYVKHRVPYTGYNPDNNTYNFYYRKTDTTETRTETVVVTTSSQSVFTLPANESYEPNTNSLAVFVNNTEILLGSGFTETSSTTFTVNSAVVAGTNVRYMWKPSWYRVPYNNGTNILNPYVDTTKYARTESVGADYSYFNFRPLQTGTYDIKFEVTFYNEAVSPSVPYKKEFVFNDFTVKYSLEKNDVYEQKDGGIRSCNRIRLHFNRLILFGDTAEPTQVYFSHLDNPAYFPAVNMFRFDTGKKEPVVTIERIQNYLTVFTKTTIHTITGTGVSDFAINLINDSVGCIAERSAVLTGNVVTFLSQEGVYVLKPANFKLDQLNVQRADTKLKSEIEKDINACGGSHDAQYFLCYPDDSDVYRFYYEQGAWVKDSSAQLNFVQFLSYSGNFYAVTADGKLLKKSETVYKDNEASYDMIVETKYFDLSKSFNFKKLKKLYMLARGYDQYDAEFEVKVFADSAIVLDPQTGYASINQNDYVVWNTTTAPNVEIHQASLLGEWVLGEDVLGGQTLSVSKTRIRGKCRRVKLQIVNSQDSEVEIFGLGLEFKLKKP